MPVHTDSNAPPLLTAQSGWRFWVTLLSICVSLFLCSFDLTAVAIALPPIANLSITGFNFSWVVSAYVLSATAFIPVSAGLAQAIGRRPAFLISNALFILGSGIAAAGVELESLDMLIASRVPQGLGAGGMQTVGALILSEHIPLERRSRYSPLLNLMLTVPYLIAPVVAGELPTEPWIFLLNVPIAGLLFILTAAFVNSPSPRPKSRTKVLTRIDWVGNALIVGGTGAIATALVWGGSMYSWSSYKVLLPLILGLLGLGASVFWEIKYAVEPIVPVSVLTNRTTISGYIQTFCAGVVTYAVIYYLPVYYAGCTDSRPHRIGIYLLGIGAVVPAAIVAWTFIYFKRRYRPTIWFGWSFVVVGVALLAKAKAGESPDHVIGVSGLIGAGLGFLFITTVHAVQAPLESTQHARALLFFVYLRTLSGVWGIAIGASVLQNQLQHRIPSSFFDVWVESPRNAAWMYAYAPSVRSMEEPWHSMLQYAYKDSLQIVWAVVGSIAGLALLSSFFMRPLPLQEHMKGSWLILMQSWDEQEDDKVALRDAEHLQDA